MKRISSILVLLCFALYSCSTGNVWDQWSDEGILDPDRLLPSELKAALCAEDGWKINYGGSDFYFQFFEGGYVQSDSDETILESQVESTYYLDYDSDQAVNINIPDGGALQYLSTTTTETTFLVTECNNGLIVATGEITGTQINFEAVTASDIEKNNEAKEAAIIEAAREKFIEELTTTMANGVIRDSSGKFIAHYALSGETDDYAIKFSVIEDRVLSHTESVLTITSDDYEALFSFPTITLNGYSISEMVYSFATSAISVSGTTLYCETNSGAVSVFTDSFSTHKISHTNNTGDACDAVWNDLEWSPVGDIEFSDRSARPLVLCPNWGSSDYVYYTFYDSNWKTTDEIGRIYFSATDPYMSYGGTEKYDQIAENYAVFFDAFFHEDGHYMIWDSSTGTSYMYLISPTTNYWMRFDK